ncbi:hypothetical protein ACLB2K_002472 [Fragaria x ananassa]
MMKDFDSSSPIRLNIGGKKFYTTITTLTQRDPDSMLAAMFSGRHTLSHEKGYVFVDRDGKHFRHILNWLRDGVVPILKDSIFAELLREAEYYQLLPGCEADVRTGLKVWTSVRSPPSGAGDGAPTPQKTPAASLTTFPPRRVRFFPVFRRDHPKLQTRSISPETGKERTRRGGKVVGDAAGVFWGGGAPSSAPEGGERTDVRALSRVRTSASHPLCVYIYICIQKRSKADFRTRLKVRTSLRSPPDGFDDGPPPPERTLEASPITSPCRQDRFEEDSPAKESDRGCLWDAAGARSGGGAPSSALDEGERRDVRTLSQGLIDEIHAVQNNKKDDEESESELTRTDILKCIQSEKVRFRGVNLSGLDLSKLDLSFVDFSYACLKNVFFSRANLHCAKFKDADAEGAIFHNANLRECEFTGANLRGALLAGTNLQSANLQDACLIDCSFCQADLRSAHLQNADLSNANLEGAILEGANLKGAKLSNTNLKDANLQRAYLRQVNLRDTHLEGAKLDGANLLGAIR